MKELVRLRLVPLRSGRSSVYILDFKDLDGKRQRLSLGHANKRKAGRARDLKERELRAGICGAGSVRLKAFMEDSFRRTGNQIRQSTRKVYENAMNKFIAVVGNIDIQALTIKHGECFRQACFDKGNSDATVNKDIRALKRIFQLALERRQLEENPFRFLKKPRCRKKKVIMFQDDECRILVQNAKHATDSQCVNWRLLIVMAIETGMRKSELLNLTWQDIDFESRTVWVTAKKDTKYTWEWRIKDCDERELPLSENALKMLAQQQGEMEVGCPYVLVPPNRLRHIQELRRLGEWSYEDSRLKVLPNFKRDFGVLRRRCGISEEKRFHDLRSTAITNWFRQGLNLEDIRRLAGHATILTTQEFYLAVADGLMDRARAANAVSGADIWQSLGSQGTFMSRDEKRGSHK